MPVLPEDHPLANRDIFPMDVLCREPFLILEIDKNIEVIENQAFYGCKNLNDIRYNGTMEEWKEIKKGAGWDYDTGDYKVYCSDGTLDKNGNVAVNP